MPWKDELNDEYKGSPAFKDIGDDINDLAKNYLDVQSHLGNAIRIPSAEATPEDVTKFHARLKEKVPGLIPTPDGENPETIEMFLTALGKPEKSDGYKLPEIEGVDIDEERGKLFMKTAHELSMTQKQLEGFLGKMYDADLVNQDVLGNLRQEDAVALKKEWGVTHENRMKALTDNLLLTEAPPELVDALKNGMLTGANIKWLDSIFDKFSSEDKNLDDKDKHLDQEGIVPSEAMERAAEVRAKLTDPNTPKIGPEYDALLAKLLKYEAMAHPDSSKNINDLRAGVRSG